VVVVETCLDVGDFTHGASDHGTGQVRHPAGYTGRFCLRGGLHSGQKKKHNEYRGLHRTFSLVLAPGNQFRLVFKVLGRVFLAEEETQSDKLTGGSARGRNAKVRLGPQWSSSEEQFERELCGTRAANFIYITLSATGSAAAQGVVRCNVPLAKPRPQFCVSSVEPWCSEHRMVEYVEVFCAHVELDPFGQGEAPA
jgi:hypothetical protein